MKLLLIRPPFAIEKFYFPKYINEPLGIESLAAFLEQTHQVMTIDAVGEGWNQYWELPDYPETIFQGLKQQEILNKLPVMKPEIIGISWLFSTQNSSIDLIIKTVKKYNKNLPIIVGGPHPSADPIQTLKDNSDIDMVVFGEGELTFKEILDLGGKNLDKINGLAYRQNEKIIKNSPRQLIDNLDLLPIPRRQKDIINNYSKQKIYQTIYSKLNKLKLPDKMKMSISSIASSLPYLDLIYYKLYNQKLQHYLPEADIITSRGCPNHCTFCAIHNVWGHRWRMRSAKHILKEIELLVKKFGIKHLNFQDDNFNVSKARTIEICQEIVKNKYNISILAPAGAFVPTLDEEVLTWLKKAGLAVLRMSIESGNQKILDNVIKKRIDLAQVKNIVNICKKLGIYTEGAFIFGIPGETIENMQESLKYAESVGFNRIVKFIFQPFPNTELYQTCLDNNYLIEEYDPKKIYITGNKSYVKTDKFTPEDVQRIVGRY